MRFLSLFAGVGGFDLGFERQGFECIGQVEIDPHALGVLKSHWPDVPKHGDITTFRAMQFGPADVITFGSPCQDLSVAGGRAGMAGERSGLFSEAIRIIREMREATNGEYPRVVIWENVPGALSSNDGKDIIMALDELEGSGYVVDLELYDSQFFGVPQRRRRIFATCLSVSHIRKLTTPTSVSITAQLIQEILLLASGVASKEFALRLQSSGYQNRCADGLKRRMSLFGLTSADACATLAENFVEVTLKLAQEPEASELPSESPQSGESATGTPAADTSMRTGSGELSGITSESLKKALAEALSLMNSSTTSTVTSETTDPRIYMFSQAALSTSKLTAALIPLSPLSWSEESCGLTVLKEFIAYARQSRDGLFTPMDWVQRWGDYWADASDHHERLERHLTGERASEIFFKSEGLRGNPEKGEEAREGIAADAEDGAGGGSWPARVAPTLGSSYYKGQANQDFFAQNGGLYVPGSRSEDDAEEAGIENLTPGETQRRRIYGTSGISPALSAEEGRGQGVPTVAACQTSGVGQRYDAETETLIPTFAVRTAQTSANGHGVAEEVSHTLDGANGQVVAFNTYGGNKRADRPEGGFYVELPAEQSKALGTSENLTAQQGGTGVLAFAQNTRDEVRLIGGDGQTVGALAAQPGMKQTTYIAELAPSLGANSFSPTKSPSGQQADFAIVQNYAVRRLTPTECERLQFFPDHWTLYDDQGNEIADTHRYRMLGNAVTVSVIEWIAKRIAERMAQ